MTDHFAALGLPRRPWLDPEALKEKFHTLSATVHPDRVHGGPEAGQRAAQDRYTALNAAQQCLRDPRARLAHLLELERGTRPGVIQSVTPDLMEVFFSVGQRLKEAEAFLAEKATVTSPLLLVALFARGQELSDRLEQARQALVRRQAELDTELRRLDEAWCAAADADGRAALHGRLEDIHRLLSYFSRWNGQLQERIVQITLS